MKDLNPSCHAGKKKKKNFIRSPHSLCYSYPHLGKPNNGQTQPSRPTMSLTYLYYGVGLLQSETSAGTSLGLCNYKQYKVGASPIPVIPVPQFRFVPITQGPRIITVSHMWALKSSEEIEPWCCMYLRKKKLKPMAMTSIESIRKIVRLCDVRRSLEWTCGGERNVTYIPTEYMGGFT